MVVVATGVRDLRDNRDSISAFTVTNWTEDLDFDANTATDTVQSNAIAYIFQTLIDQGIINGTVS